MTIGAARHRTRPSGGPPLESQDFESFYEANERRLYGTLCLVTGDLSEAEELMQEAFLRIWERWDKVRTVGDPAAYLYKTAFNLNRSRLRRAARAARRLVQADRGSDAFEEVEEREDLRTAMRSLTPRQRAAVVLVDLIDLPSEEAARILGVKAVTVRALASQARRALGARVEQPNV